MRYTWATATHVGHLRDGNEDFVTPDEDGAGDGPLVVAIADGMGGHVGGEIASRLAVEAAIAPPPGADVAVRDRIELGNDAVVAATEDDPRLAGMGTTLTLGLFDPDGMLHIGHVGDSRLYLLRDGELEQLTRDHTWVMDMLSRGQLSPEQAETHPRRHLLTRVLGMIGVQVDDDSVELHDGDRILICSDGLTTMLRDDAIAAIVRDAETPSDAVWALVEGANAAGGYDNTTVAVVDVAP
jgi:protein phosphatase